MLLPADDRKRHFIFGFGFFCTSFFRSFPPVTEPLPGNPSCSQVQPPERLGQKEPFQILCDQSHLCVCMRTPTSSSSSSSSDESRRLPVKDQRSAGKRGKDTDVMCCFPTSSAEKQINNKEIKLAPTQASSSMTEIIILV